MSGVSTRSRLAGCAVAVLLSTACTAGGAGDRPVGASQSPAPSASGAAEEQKLTEQAKAALDDVRGGTVFAAGVERAADGFHNETTVARGRTYRLSVVCVGSGSARLGFTPARYGAGATVPCDRSVVQRRITGLSEALRIDVDGAEGATGVIAWEIDDV